MYCVHLSGCDLKARTESSPRIAEFSVEVNTVDMHRILGLRCSERRGIEAEAVRGGCRKLRSEDLYRVYFPSNILMTWN
jgi:hypothetical protein